MIQLKVYSKQYDIDDIENRFLALLQWRRFNFFDKEVLKDSESDQVYDKLKVHQWIIICIISTHLCVGWRSFLYKYLERGAITFHCFGVWLFLCVIRMWTSRPVWVGVGSSSWGTMRATFTWSTSSSALTCSRPMKYASRICTKWNSTIFWFPSG